MRFNERPIMGDLYMCHSRNALLRCIGWTSVTGGEELCHFERVFSMSKWKREQKPEGFREALRVRELDPLVRVNEMEALAYASR